jgi:NAD(P)H-dependent flavin oxidoreductase YrpB (nitropropane dioxygenase family)
MIKTPLCELLGIEYPIFQGGMAWIADADLAASVSEAGGLGSSRRETRPPIMSGPKFTGQKHSRKSPSASTSC